MYSSSHDYNATLSKTSLILLIWVPFPFCLQENDLTWKPNTEAHRQKCRQVSMGFRWILYLASLQTAALKNKFRQQLDLLTHDSITPISHPCRVRPQKVPVSELSSNTKAQVFSIVPSCPPVRKQSFNHIRDTFLTQSHHGAQASCGPSLDERRMGHWKTRPLHVVSLV